ncbi:MAG TPA: HD domain-containing phosphohydrolase [Candidatus Limnocylindria bacterium]|nr:HD domain-containing phosphohydrolase [Candidatus Limnocylindria bacterium]
MSIVSTAQPATSVVVVEDDPASADVLQRRLQANGMTVVVGRDGGEGLALVKQLVPDLVLLDVMLPDTDGYDVCLRIKSDGTTAHIPVIFLSARGEVVDKVRGLSCGAADYVTKPWNAAELLARIDAVLAQSRTARAPRLERPSVRPERARPVVAVTLSDEGRRHRAQTLLAPVFDIADEGRGDPDLVLVDAGGVLPPDFAPDETAVLEIVGEGVAPGPEAARLDDELPRMASLLVRERRIERDLDAAADALITLATALESHDRSTMGHSERVAARAVAIAQVLGLDEQAVRTIRLGALLRDIGNAKLPPALVHKAGELTAGERELVERHPTLGEDVLRGLAPLRAILPIVRSHHERLDGGGYPDRLRADALPLEVRVVTVADRFEALLVDRPDRAKVSEQEAVRILQGAVTRGELDPAVVAALAAQVRSGGEVPR